MELLTYSGNRQIRPCWTSQFVISGLVRDCESADVLGTGTQTSIQVAQKALAHLCSCWVLGSWEQSTVRRTTALHSPYLTPHAIEVDPDVQIAPYVAPNVPDT